MRMPPLRSRTVRILLVDDDEDDYVLTKDLLTDFRWARPQLEWEGTFAGALKMMLHCRHDVYLLDYRIGADSGLDLMREAMLNGCRAPVILMTGQGDHEVDMQAMEAGAADYLVKGTFDAPMLERSIRYAIQQKRTEAELAEMQARLADARENERLHLAQELHDGPLQDLIGARFHLGALANRIVDEQPAAQLASVQNSLQMVINTLRAMCGELRPPALAPFGLEKAIRAHVKSFCEAYPYINVQLNLDSDNQSLPERVRLALFRIYQHAVANVANHAEAKKVRVEFRMDENVIQLEVEDDGKGFDVPERWLDLAREGHLGLLGAAERAESIGGQLLVRSQPGVGTALVVTVKRQVLHAAGGTPSAAEPEG
jgi:signal transduction histidine kinase